MSFRKRAQSNESEHEPISEQLRSASELLDAGEYAEGLSVLDAVAAQSNDAERCCQVAVIAAQADLLQGRFASAANTFATAWKLGAETPTAWFAAALGQIRAQLRNVDVENAFTEAERALAQATKAHAAFAGLASSAGAALSRGGAVTVDRAPIRPSVAAFRLGQQLWEEGEPEKALRFFGRAIELEPEGSCRARIAIARIALINESFEAAYEGARAALLGGHFRGKTLSAWPVLIAAAQKLGHRGVEPNLVGGLQQATPLVRGRARFIIAKTLRAFGDSAWLDFADIPPAEDRHFVLQAEMAKLKVASATSAPEAADLDRENAAAELLATPNLGPKEWLGAAKAALLCELAEGIVPRFEAVISAGVALYGESQRPVIAHGLALACQKANRSDLALALLRPLAAGVATAPPASLWLLAQLEGEGGNISRAADLCAALADRSDVPARFQMLATLQWARFLADSGDAERLAQAAPRLVAAARTIQDYELLLDLGRQMTLAPAEIAAQAKGVFDRGQQLAWQAFSVQEQPAGALEILFKLARRQSDFGAYAAIARAWEQLSPAKRDWLWTASGTYWQYLGLVAAAYRCLARPSAADALATRYLEDPATPANGLAELGVPHALSYLARGNPGEAFGWFEWIIWQAPTHILCAYAHYWLALRAERQGDAEEVEKRLNALRLSLGSSFGLSWMKELDARARLLAGTPATEIAARSEYSESFLAQQASSLIEDRRKL